MESWLYLLAIYWTRCLTLEVTDDRYYPYYHLAPPGGRMQDPNGFSQFKGEYHLFYQYNPDSSEEIGKPNWGHAKSEDLFHWEHQPIAMRPDKDFDRNGVFSGSAIAEGDRLILFYTGVDTNENQVQNLATFKGGKVKKFVFGDPVIKGKDFQPDFRDPKIWKRGDDYFAVIGNSFFNGTRGRALLFKSQDTVTWYNVSVLESSTGGLGYMWEMPDFFKLDGKWVLLFSTQGVRRRGDRYNNLYQTVYIVGDFDEEDYTFATSSEFRELDSGHDFYASQTMLDKDHRRLVVAWADMYESNEKEGPDGWAGQMIIPRVLSLRKDDVLLQKPVKEIKDLRGEELYSGKAGPGTTVKIPNNSGEVKIKAPNNKDFELYIVAEAENRENNNEVVIFYDKKRGKLVLDRGGTDGIRRTRWRPEGDDIELRVFIDRSSIEVFTGDGEVTFTSRFFPGGPVSVKIGPDSDAKMLKVYQIGRTTPKPDNE